MDASFTLTDASCRPARQVSRAGGGAEEANPAADTRVVGALIVIDANHDIGAPGADRRPPHHQQVASAAKARAAQNTNIARRRPAISGTCAVGRRLGFESCLRRAPSAAAAAAQIAVTYVQRPNGGPLIAGGQARPKSGHTGRSAGNHRQLECGLASWPSGARRIIAPPRAGCTGGRAEMQASNSVDPITR